jgi:hypothetical protein
MRRWLNPLGLIFGMIGVVMIFFWGWPQPSFEGDVLTADTSAQQQAELKTSEEHYRFMSKLGLGLVFLGFGCQLIAALAPSDRR